MKKHILSFCLLLAGTGAMAQTVYTNADISSTSDLIGTARYVGMGGALGALGADISAISSNPASIGLFRRSTLSLTAGGLWQSDKNYDERNTSRGTFDQAGFVASFPVSGEKWRYFNIGFNYQKQNNLGAGFYADNGHLGGLSQADQFVQQANAFASDQTFDYTLYGTAFNAGLYEVDELGFYNPYGASLNRFSCYTAGGTQLYDFNISGNISDRYYIGLSIGLTNASYDRYTTYTEEREDIYGLIQDYTINTDRRVTGQGVNIKLGTIIRPFEESPFRFGLAVETPTWYTMKTTSYFSIDSKHSFDDQGNRYYHDNRYWNHPSLDDSFLEYRLSTPWRVRLSAGSTIDNTVAWGVEYEYADYSTNHMSYSGSNNDFYDWDIFSSTTSDKAMNQANKQILQGQHTAKLGVEVNATKSLSLRAGYNYITSMYRKNAHFNQNIDSYAMDYVSETGYMNLSDVNIISCGLGFHYKSFYADLAYRYRIQSGEYYAFDDSFTTDGLFIRNNPTLANATIKPVDVNLNRSTITCTLGIKF